MILETVCVGTLETNCYILAEDEGCEAVIIDPGDQEKKIRKVLDKHRLKPGLVVNTHGHADHIGCDDKLGAVVMVHKLDAAMLKDADSNFSVFLNMPLTVNSDVRTLEDGDEVRLGRLCLKVIHVPGHSPGGIALLLTSPRDNILFSGDSLFFHSIGRTDFKGGDHNLLVKSVREKLFCLPGETLVYPGHGPSTTIAREKEENPYL